MKKKKYSSVDYVFMELVIILICAFAGFGFYIIAITIGNGNYYSIFFGMALAAVVSSLLNYWYHCTHGLIKSNRRMKNENQ